MSLLMEALKKAERAKQTALEQSDQAAAPETVELQLTPDDLAAPQPAAAPDAAGADEAGPATGESAPAPQVRDPRQGRLDFPKLELESIDDREFDLDPVKPRSAREPAAAAETEARGRAAARAVFEAKQPGAAGKKRALLIWGVGAVVIGVGAAGYFWLQMQIGGSALTGFKSATGPVTTRAPAAPPAGAPAAPVVPATQVAAIPAAQPAAPPPVTAAAANPPGGTKVPAPERAAPATPQARKALPAPRSDTGLEARAPAPARSPAAARKNQELGEVRISPPGVGVNPLLDSAYAAYLANDLTAARNAYTLVLESDAANRDALLGLAGIAARGQRYDEAESLYLRILRADPTDAYAQTGLIGIRGQADPVAAESRLKNLIASQPEAAFLHYALGNLYVRQQRWNDAEQEHFRAFALDGENADYCYNLAVSLDQLRQPRQALAHYQRALVLAASRPASFDPNRLRVRISELQQQ